MKAGGHSLREKKREEVVLRAPREKEKERERGKRRKERIEGDGRRMESKW